MWFLEWLLSVILFPIKWFWSTYKKLEEEKNVIKTILLFAVSISGLAIITIAVISGLMWLFTYHMDIVIVCGLIVWLYAYVKSKMDIGTQTEVIPQDNGETELQEQAIKIYPTIRNIMYQTLKGTAQSIGGVIPRVLQEIEVVERHFVISNGICFYQFMLPKADIKIRYEPEELREFERILQNDISRKFQAGDFPILGIQQYLDAYGNLYDAVCIDVIEDIDTCLLIQVVFCSPEYADYLRQKKINQQNMLMDSSIPDAKWKV